MRAERAATRVDEAYDRLKREIRETRLPPGFQAPEPEIALRLGMSRTPVREALIRLEKDGLVALTPRRGARVLPIDAEDMREIYQILTALEPEAAANLARRAPSRETLQPLELATADMEHALAKDDLEAWAAADDCFHRRLLALNGNRRLDEMVTTLFDQAHRARLVTLRLRARPTRSTAEHRAILDAIAAGDPKKAAQTFQKHRERAANELLALLDKSRLAHL